MTLEQAVGSGWTNMVHPDDFSDAEKCEYSYLREAARDECAQRSDGRTVGFSAVAVRC